MSNSPRAPKRSRLTSANDPVVVYGVVAAEGVETGSHIADCEVLIVRGLAAVLEACSLGNSHEVPQRVARYREVVEKVFSERTVVPNPFNTLFRSRASVARWLELHGSPLQEAIDFVSDRATMRVRVGVTGSPATEVAAASIDGLLWTALRRLKGDAVAAVPVVANADGTTGADRSAACAYLIDQESIAVFQQRVASLTSSESHLRFDVVGPLPAYDFVKMDFGG
ncbi:MAG: GvpL/GvpF family gas vesicle protein [Gemmatimonadota bacterium]